MVHSHKIVIQGTGNSLSGMVDFGFTKIYLP